MVLRLAGNVPFHLIDMGRADGKRAIAALPIETEQFFPLLLKPFGRGSLQLLDQIGDSPGSGHGAEDMDMIFRAVDTERQYPQLTADLSEIGMGMVAQFGINKEGDSFPGRKDEMEKDPAQ